ncbi:putative RecA/RadA family phage recombinase [Ancylobacter sp. 3268]|uniref:DUF2190 family protein n=1 Tax=Ancylobacter sp. 3268 TaxID=2817752 RepID=UPI00285E37A2|nr:DUF2190 family protein [Ancylobacter sp. 3268]MDR6952300.1 putative RecA/RadA family phage recombinase [Ancylobacter sp. 3268]
MKNFVAPGDTLDLTAPAGGVVSGTAYLLGALVAVANFSADAGVKVAFSRRGVFTLPKATGQAWTEGAVLYWDNTAKNFTTTVSTNTKAAVAVAAAANGDASGLVLLPGIV